MIKTLLFSTLLFISQLVFSQPVISRAFSLCIGTRENIEEEFTWSENLECNFLIVSETQKVTIHTNKKLEYHTLQDLGENEDGTSHKFLMLDQDARKCHLFISSYEDILFIIVEYSDLAVIYSTKSTSEN